MYILSIFFTITHISSIICTTRYVHSSMNRTSDLTDIKLRHLKTEMDSIVATLGSMSNMSQHCYSSMSGIAQVFVLVSLSDTRAKVWIVRPQRFCGTNL